MPTCKQGKVLYCLNFFLHNFHGARPDGTTTLCKGDQQIHGSFLTNPPLPSMHLPANEMWSKCGMIFLSKSLVRWDVES